MSENLEIEIGLKIEEGEAKSQLSSILTELKNTVENKANAIKIKIDVDKKGLDDLKKIERAVKEINKLSEDSQRALFNGGINADSRRHQQQIENQRKSQERAYRQMFDEIERNQAQRTRREREYATLFDQADRQEEARATRRQKDREKSFSSITRDIQKAQSQIDKLGQSGYVDQGELNRVRESLSQIRDIHVWENIENLDLNDERAEIERLLDSLRQINDSRLEGIRGDRIENFSSKITNDLDKIEQRFREMGRSTEGIDRLRAELQTLDQVAPDRLPQVFQRMRQEVSQLNGEIRQTGNTTSRMGGFLSDVADSMRTFTLGNMIGDGITSSVRNAVRSFKDIDDAITNVKKVAEESDIDSALELDAIKEKAVSIAKEVGMATKDVINGISSSLQAGMGSMEQSIAVARSSLMLANVGDMTQNQASSAVNTIVKGFDITPLKSVQKEMGGTIVKTNELTEAMDLLNFAGNNYAVGTDGVAEALKRGGSVLHEYGVSLSDTVALITSANEAVQNPEKVGNGMKSIAINLAGMKASSKDGTLELNKTAKALSEIAKIDVYEDKKTGKIKNMVKILDEVHKKWDGLREDEQKGLSEAIAGKQQAMIFQSLMGNFKTFEKMRSEFDSNMHLGSAERENAQYVDSISGKLNALKETWVSIGQTMVSSDFTKDLLDGAIRVSEAIDMIVKGLDKAGALTPTIVGLGVTFGNMMKQMVNNSRNGVNIFTPRETQGIWRALRNDITNTTGAMNKFKAAGSSLWTGFYSGVKDIAKGFANAGKFMLSFAGQAVMIMAVTKALDFAIKKFDDYAHGLENTEKAIKETMAEINNDISQDKESLKFLEDTQSRYDELIKKKQEYSKVPIENWTEEQVAEMEELKGITSELADLFPELVVGYDKEGSPIMLMADDMDKLKERTKEQISLNQELLKIEREKLANNARDRAQKGNFWGLGKGTIEKIGNQDKIYQDSFRQVQAGQQQMIRGLIRNEDAYVKQVEHNLDKMKKKQQAAYEEKLKLYQQHVQEELEVQQNAFDRVQATQGYDKLGDNQREGVHTFLDSLNWIGMDKNQFNSWIAGSKKIIDLASSGSPKLKEWNSKLEKANKAFSENGDMKEYEKSLKGVAQAISKDLNIPYETVFAGLKNMGRPLDDAEQSMQNFLKTFKKSRVDLLNGDGVAQALAEQFQAVDETLNNLFANKDNYFSVDGILDINIATEIANKDGIPDQIQSAIKEFTKDGKMTKQETEVTLGLLGAFELGNTEEAKKAIDEINGKLKEMGREDLRIDVKTLFDGSQIETLEQQLNSLREGSDVNLKVIVNGVDKAQLFQEIIGKLQNSPDVVNRFIIDNKDALADMNSYEEVLKWFHDNPEIVSKYKLNVEGLEELEKAESKKGLWGKDSTKTKVLKVDSSQYENAGKKVDEVDKKTDKVGKKEVKVKANSDAIQASITDIETLVKYSSEIEKGKYKLSIDTDTKKAVDNIKKLEDAMKDIGKIMAKSPRLLFKTETAQASKNITGLRNNIQGILDLKQSTTSLVFKSETAQASKNITGLINNARKCMKLKPKPIVFKAYTAQAAKNISGLIKKINSVPTGTKTLTYNVKTNYSSSGTPSSEVKKTAPKKIPLFPTRGASAPTVETMTSLVSPMTFANSELPTLLINRRGSSANRSATTSRFIQRLAQVVRTTQKTPLALKGNDISDALKFNIELLKELETRLQMVGNQISLLDKKSEHALGRDKIKYLQEQNNLYEEQKLILKEKEEAQKRQIANYQQYLKNFGLRFNKDDNMTNYEEIMLQKERELKKLEEKASKDKASDADKNKYESKRNALEELKNFAEGYFKLSFEELPKIREEWAQLDNEILDNLESIKKIKEEFKKLQEDTEYKNHNRDIKEIENKLDKNQVLLDNSTGKNKLEYLEERIRLTSQLKRENQELLKYEGQRRNDLMKELGGYGFKFRDDGSIQGYGETIQKLKKDLSDNEFDRVFSKIEDYIDTTNEKIPTLEKNIIDLGFSVFKYQDELMKLERDRALEPHLNAVKKLENEYDKLADKLSLIEVKIRNAYGTDKINLIKEQIALLTKQREEQEKLVQEHKNMVGVYQKDLISFGVKFDDNGDISNLDSILNSFQDDRRLPILKELIDEYLSVQRDKLPDVIKEWESLGASIKDAYKEQLNTTKEIESQITDVYKKQKEEREKLIEEELKKKLDAIKKEKDAYNKSREEAKYKNDYKEQLEKVEKLNSLLEVLKRDTSMSNQKKIQDVLDQLKEEQEKLQNMVQDKIDDQVNDMFDKESDRLEEQAKKEKDELEDRFSDKNIQELVKKALNTGVFEDIDGTMRSLQETMLNFVDNYGEGLGATGDLIKNELVANLEIAKETMKDMVQISKDLGLIKYNYDSEPIKNAVKTAKVAPLETHNRGDINFNESLINIEGNVDKDVVEELKKVAKDIESSITKNIVKAIR